VFEIAANNALIGITLSLETMVDKQQQ